MLILSYENQFSFTCKWKLIFTWKDVHQDSENEAKGNLEMAYYYHYNSELEQILYKVKFVLNQEW